MSESNISDLEIPEKKLSELSDEELRMAMMDALKTTQKVIKQHFKSEHDGMGFLQSMAHYALSSVVVEAEKRFGEAKKQNWVVG